MLVHSLTQPRLYDLGNGISAQTGFCAIHNKVETVFIPTDPDDLRVVLKDPYLTEQQRLVVTRIEHTEELKYETLNLQTRYVHA